MSDTEPKTPSDREDRVLVRTHLRSEDVRRLARCAAARDVPRAIVIREAVRLYLDAAEPKP